MYPTVITPLALQPAGPFPGREPIMKLPHNRNSERQGFTMIELLVVIAIIAILVALTTSAVIKVFGKGPEVAAANDIHQLKMALENFKNKFGVYPPSRILLSNNVNDYVNDPQSLAILMQLWPRL